jgi:uncharacterized membrane protein YphA (DoxX/SURF4 family)
MRGHTDAFKQRTKELTRTTCGVLLLLGLVARTPAVGIVVHFTAATVISFFYH